VSVKYYTIIEYYEIENERKRRGESVCDYLCLLELSFSRSSHKFVKIIQFAMSVSADTSGSLFSLPGTVLLFGCAL